jgi:dihydroceramidase
LSPCHSTPILPFGRRFRDADRLSFYLPNPIYHQLAFGGILISGVTRNFIFLGRLKAAPEADPAVRAKVVRTLLLGIATFVVGFIIWNIDNFFCEALRRGRDVLGPLGFVLQGEHLATRRQTTIGN